jgi:predicted aminopeptidase
MHRLLTITLLTALLAACKGAGFYRQAIDGHLDLLARARPIAEIVADPATDTALKQRLTVMEHSRVFASRELKLPDNGSYTRYAELDRPYALWNVFAAPKLSLTLKQWCFPVAGCVSYRGYFSHDAALEAADALRAEGYDVYVGGVAAYSTLGWSEDPLTSPMLARSDAEAVALMFHELAHQRLYVRDDTAFNESFAVAVEHEGMRRWLKTVDEGERYARFREKQARRDEVIATALDYRTQLAQLYASSATETEKLAEKERILEALRREAAARRERGQDGGLGAWLEKDLNNAKLASLGLYHRHVPAFERLLAEHDGDLEAFYRAAEELAHRPATERAALLAAPSE